MQFVICDLMINSWHWTNHVNEWCSICLAGWYFIQMNSVSPLTHQYFNSMGCARSYIGNCVLVVAIQYRSKLPDDIFSFLVRFTLLLNSYMMTSSNGRIFVVIGPLCGKFTGHQWIPLTKASDVELWWYLWPAHEQTVEQTIEIPVI